MAQEMESLNRDGVPGFANSASVECSMGSLLRGGFISITHDV